MADKKTWEPTDETKNLLEKYGHLLNNTGGNDPVDLMREYHTNDNLMTVNIVVFTLAVSVESQLNLLRKLIKEGLLDG